jgi:hypothetical protein
MSGVGTADPRRERERQWANWALGRWTSFPMDQEPRPLGAVNTAIASRGTRRIASAVRT